MTNDEILNLPFESRDIGETTVRGYFKALLNSVLKNGESFSGKRPFGNSGWEYDIAEPLVKAGIVAGSFGEPYEDDAPELEEVDWTDFQRVADMLVEAL